MGEAKRRRQVVTGAFSQLQGELSALGVNTEEFGFYDQEAFLAAERRNPDFLEKYAQWVMLRPMDDLYRTRIRELIPRISKIIVEEFREYGMQGGCVAASGMLTRVLDRIGLWSFAVSGSLTLDVKRHGLRRMLHSVDKPDLPGAALGHAWVVAPPFKVVDPTISLQHWEGDDMGKYVPEYVIADDTAKIMRPAVHDVVCNEFRHEYFIREGRNDPDLHYRLEPRLRTFGANFSAVSVVVGELELHYTPVAVRQTDVPLELINTTSGRGRPAIEIWRERIAPALGLDVSSGC